MKKTSKALCFLLLLFMGQFAFADQAGDIATITAPLTKIYDLVKAVVSIIGVLALTYAGARFMFSGDNLQARENAKSIVTYALAGLVLVWIAPLVVNFLTVAPAP